MILINGSSLRSTVIDLLSKDPMSLTDLQAATQVSLPTLRHTIQELSDTGWVCPVGRSSSTGGRRATLYGLDGETHLIVGVHLELPAINMVTIGLDGQIVDYVHLPGDEARLPDDALKRIGNYVQRVKTTHPNRQILGIGVATPGYIDPPSGQILSIGRVPHWQNFPLKARLEADLDLPVTVENDIDCMTSVELAHADLPATADVLYLGFSEGVKVSMLLGGRLYKGPFGNAGLIGRTAAALQDEVETSEGHKYLNETMSVGSVCQAFDQRMVLQPDRSEALDNIAALTERSAKFQAILDAAENEPICRAIVVEIVDFLAVELSNLVYILQPEMLIIGGALSNMPFGFRTYLENSIRKLLPSLISNHLLIKYGSMTGTRVAAVGAAHRFLQYYNIPDA